MPTGMQKKAVASTVLGLAAMCLAAGAQTTITDADLEAASRGRVVRLGALLAGGAVTTLPLETYVSRVLAGEAEPRAAEGAYQALAVAIRTFALANAGRHERDGFDLCDTTHCQVPRAGNATTRRAALATAGQVLTYNGGVAEVFYSASCGGRSEDARMRWEDFRTSTNVEDRRGMGIPGGRGGLGIGTIVILGLLGWALGIDPRLLISGAEMMQTRDLAPEGAGQKGKLTVSLWLAGRPRPVEAAATGDQRKLERTA